MAKEGSTCPNFDITMITDLPSTRHALVVAYVASHERDDVVELELSVRSVQRLLRRRSHQTAASILRRLSTEVG